MRTCSTSRAALETASAGYLRSHRHVRTVVIYVALTWHMLGAWQTTNPGTEKLTVCDTVVARLHSRHSRKSEVIERLKLPGAQTRHCAMTYQVRHVGGDVVHSGSDQLLRVAVQERRPARAVRHVEMVQVDALMGDVVQQLSRLSPVIDAVEVRCVQRSQRYLTRGWTTWSVRSVVVALCDR